MDTMSTSALTGNTATSNISALIQVQQSVSDAARAGIRATGIDADSEEAKAREAANQFESLLIHNMLKSMRKTTLAENTSNQRAIYDDMLDKNLADTMIKSGGLGLADQLMQQLHGQRRQADAADTAGANSQSAQAFSEDRMRLRELAGLIDRKPTQGSEDDTESTSALHTQTGAQQGLQRLKMLAGLWNSPTQGESDNSRIRREFLHDLAPHAQQSARRLGTSTSAVLAIAALETGWGQSLPRDADGESGNNYFGIKAISDTEAHTRNSTTEYVNGQSQTVQARFKSYDSPADSIAGFADFLLQNPRYSTALQHAGNPERFIRELHDAGYATDPRYAEKAITVMRQVEQHETQP